MMDPSLFNPGGPLAGLMKDGQINPTMLASLLQKTGPKLGEIDSEGGMHVQPEAGFVVKTHETNHKDNDKGFKVFINICGCVYIDKMHERSIAEGESNGGQQAIRIPLSIGELREDIDKQNLPCHTVDVLINTETLTQALIDPNLKGIIGDFASLAVGQKFKNEFAGVSFPKLKYKGTLPPPIQRIRASKLSEIQEIHDDKMVSDRLPIHQQNSINSNDGITTPPPNAKSNKIPNVLPNFNLYFYHPTTTNCHPLAAFMDGSVLNQEEVELDDDGVPLRPPTMGMTLNGHELPLFVPPELSGEENQLVAETNQMFDFGKALKGSKKVNDERRSQAEKFKIDRKNALESIVGCTMRIEVPMPYLKANYLKAEAHRLFTVAICDDGVQVISNRLSSVMRSPDLDKLSQAELDKIRNPAYAPLSLKFPILVQNASQKCKVWWDSDERILTIDISIPEQIDELNDFITTKFVNN